VFLIPKLQTMGSKAFYFKDVLLPTQDIRQLEFIQRDVAGLYLLPLEWETRWLPTRQGSSRYLGTFHVKQRLDVSVKRSRWLQTIQGKKKELILQRQGLGSHPRLASRLLLSNDPLLVIKDDLECSRMRYHRGGRQGSAGHRFSSALLLELLKLQMEPGLHVNGIGGAAYVRASPIIHLEFGELLLDNRPFVLRALPHGGCLLLRAYAIDAGKDSDCRKQQTHSSDVYSVFGVPATAREAVGESLDAEFCQRGGVVHANLVKKRN
jgi:hypothetical protein